MSGEETETPAQTWLGTPLSELYIGEGPWGFATAPVFPSKYHQVLYEIPVHLTEPPEPHRNSNPRHWDDDHVRMPFSPHSLFLVKNGSQLIRPRWDVIKEALSKPINSVDDFELAVNCYNHKLPKFTALQRFFNNVLEEEETQHFFNFLLPKIIQLALSLPDRIPGSIPLLKRNHCKSISLSQIQVATLLANAFLCTLVWRRKMSDSFPGVNFARLFSCNERQVRQDCVAEKLKCIMHYFRRVTDKTPIGVITFERKFLVKNQMPRWDILSNNLGNTKVHVTSSGTIEEGSGFLQVDFANKFVGGGVMAYGCVQEEIRFVICPELIISRLFTEALEDNEALSITGVERFSNYSGYANTFRWDGNYEDDTPYDESGRRRTTVAVIDAIKFNNPRDQFHCAAVLREVNKAYIGFRSREKQNLAPVATGNWGCGAFKGDPYLKSLLQLMACNAAGRDLVYYSFGDVELRDEFYKMYQFLANNSIKIHQLWRYLCRFCSTSIYYDKLYAFIQQSHFDQKSQPSVKQFLCFGTQKRKPEINLPSTSREQVKTKKNSSHDREEDEAKPRAEKVLALPVVVEKKESVVAEKKETVVKPEEIIHIIDQIDGNLAKRTDNGNKEETLLSQIDKIKQIDVKEGDKSAIPMEVDQGNPKPEEKKRKITDYFCKVTDHVNSLL